ncbi:MAG: Uma2 family endonuclease [Desulfurispora sp.]|uniref:Uma2 family endonuclease n=1 Tax=Desulfurispora sp. TaxID=3014275 RepID=UPI00404A4242
MLSLPQAKERYCYTDYLQWPDNQRWELINGVPYLMTPAPSRRHQEILGNLFGLIWSFLRSAAGCRVFMAPFDVRLPAKGQNEADIDNVVQPDLVVVCDETRLDEKGCLGAPDIVVEIISLATARKDLGLKFDLYERCGVPEYWVVFPQEKAVQVYKLNSAGQYERGGDYGPDSVLTTEILPGLEINLAEVFG